MVKGTPIRRRLPAWSAEGRVLMLDLAGHGESSRPDASYTLDWHANLVGARLEELGLEAVDLVGHSYGGGVAQQWMLLGSRRRIWRLGLEAAGEDESEAAYDAPDAA